MHVILWCCCIHLQLCCLWTLSKCLAYGLWERGIWRLLERHSYLAVIILVSHLTVVCFCMLKYWFSVCNIIWLKPSFILRSTHSEYSLGYYKFFRNCICVPYYYWPLMLSCAFFSFKKAFTGLKALYTALYTFLVRVICLNNWYWVLFFNLEKFFWVLRALEY